jgi:hypothetical protein
MDRADVVGWILRARWAPVSSWLDRAAGAGCDHAFGRVRASLAARSVDRKVVVGQPAALPTAVKTGKSSATRQERRREGSGSSGLGTTVLLASG